MADGDGMEGEDREGVLADAFRRHRTPGLQHQQVRQEAGSSLARAGLLILGPRF